MKGVDPYLVTYGGKREYQPVTKHDEKENKGKPENKVPEATRGKGQENDNRQEQNAQHFIYNEYDKDVRIGGGLHVEDGAYQFQSHEFDKISRRDGQAGIPRQQPEISKRVVVVIFQHHAGIESRTNHEEKVHEQGGQGRLHHLFTELPLLQRGAEEQPEKVAEVFGKKISKDGE